MQQVVEKMQVPEVKGKRVLITGGLGFLGSNIAHKLVEEGAEVTLFNNTVDNLANVVEIRNNVEIIKGDIRKLEQLKEPIKDKDIVFNCAAQISHPLSMKNPFLDIDINCVGAMTVLEAARQFNDSARIVFSTTSTQVGKMLYCPIDELHPEFPTDVYAADKYAGEKYHLVYNKAYGLPTSVVRLSNMYGPRARIGSANVIVINYFIGLALQGKEITVFEPGTQTRNVLYVEDAVNAMIFAAEKEKAIGEVFFACSDEKYPIIKIAEEIISIAGKGSLKLVPWPKERKSIEIGDVDISNKKIKEVLGWSAQFSLNEGLKKTIQFYENRLEDYLVKE